MSLTRFGLPTVKRASCVRIIGTSRSRKASKRPDGWKADGSGLSHSFNAFGPLFEPFIGLIGPTSFSGHTRKAKPPSGVGTAMSSLPIDVRTAADAVSRQHVA